MTNTRTLLIAIAASVAFTASAASAAPLSKAETDKVIASVKATEAQWSAETKSKDPARFASYYTEDATVMNPGSPVTHTRAAAAAAMKEAYADPNFSLSFGPDEAGVSPDGALAWTQGHCVVTQTDPGTHAKVTQGCSYVTLYRKDASGAWKAFQDISTPTP